MREYYHHHLIAHFWLKTARRGLQLHEQDELIWNDGVAPETAIDFDAPHLSAGYGLLWWLGGFGFFYSVYAFAKATAHPLNKPSVSRRIVVVEVRVLLCGIPCVDRLFIFHFYIRPLVRCTTAAAACIYSGVSRCEITRLTPSAHEILPPFRHREICPKAPRRRRWELTSTGSFEAPGVYYLWKARFLILTSHWMGPRTTCADELLWDGGHRHRGFDGLLVANGGSHDTRAKCGGVWLELFFALLCGWGLVYCRTILSGYFFAGESQ